MCREMLTGKEVAQLKLQAKNMFCDKQEMTKITTFSTQASDLNDSQ